MVLFLQHKLLLNVSNGKMIPAASFDAIILRCHSSFNWVVCIAAWSMSKDKHSIKVVVIKVLCPHS